MLKFSEIKTAAELRTRIKMSGEVCTLSFGNQYHHVRHLLSMTGRVEDIVVIYYTANPGNHSVARYLTREA